MNTKALLEKRNGLKAQADAILASAKKENRAITADEKASFDACVNEIGNIDATLAANDALANLGEPAHPAEPVDKNTQDIVNLATYIRNKVNDISNTASNLTTGDNGAVIPTSVANKIIAKVVEISPIYALATKYNVKGTFNIPVVDTSVDDVTVAFATEFVALTSHAPKTTSISLTGYLYGALTKVSKALIKGSDFDLVNFVVNRMAENIAVFIEGQLINGTTNFVAGIAGSYDSTNMKVTFAKKSSVTTDELIDIQELVPDKFQANAIWIMSKGTRKLIRKLKDSDGQYLLNKDVSSKWGYTLLNKDVYVSQNAPALGTAGNLAVIYGDMSGLAVKEAEPAEIQILNELFAAEHAVGIVGWGEIDAKVENKQKIACGACGSADT